MVARNFFLLTLNTAPPAPNTLKFNMPCLVALMRHGKGWRGLILEVAGHKAYVGVVWLQLRISVT